MDILNTLYGYISDFGSQVESDNRMVEVPLDEVILRAKDEGVPHVFSQFYLPSAAVKSNCVVEHISSDGIIYVTHLEKTKSLEDTQTTLDNLRQTLADSGLTETPIDGQFLVNGSHHYRAVFGFDQFRSHLSSTTTIHNRNSFDAWAEEIQCRDGVLAYCHYQTGTFGNNHRERMNELTLSDAMFEFVMPYQTRFATRLPDDLTMDEALALVPQSVKRVDVAPFVLFSKESFRF